MDLFELEEKRKLLDLWAARQQANQPYNIMMQTINQPPTEPRFEARQEYVPPERNIGTISARPLYEAVVPATGFNPLESLFGILGAGRPRPERVINPSELALNMATFGGPRAIGWNPIRPEPAIKMYNTGEIISGNKTHALILGDIEKRTGVKPRYDQMEGGWLVKGKYFPEGKEYEASQYAKSFEPRKFSSLYDKKPRFEISDEAMQLNVSGLAKAHRGEDVALGDVITHGELFKNYPRLMDIRFKVQEGASGNYSPLENSITIGKASTSRRDDIIHEIQHAIQEYEGFARGGNQMTDFITKELISERRKLTINPDGTMRGFSKSNPVDIRDYKKVENINKTLDNPKKLVEMAKEAYFKQAGEIEARDAAFRRLYSDYERSRIQPFISQGIPPEEAIVRFGNK